jgi:hypothetical protein
MFAYYNSVQIKITTMFIIQRLNTNGGNWNPITCLNLISFYRFALNKTFDDVFATNFLTTRLCFVIFAHEFEYKYL